jgi:hypothetical protein
MRTAAASGALRTQNPDKPWLWRKDWKDGVIVSHGTAQSVTLAIFALVWNLIASPAAWVVYERGLFRTTPLLSIVLIFPLIGVFLFISAAYQLLRAIKYGQSRLMLPHVPISPGTTCRGEIATRMKERPESGFTLKLACVRRVVSGSGKSRTIRENDIWRDEQRVSAAALIPTNDGVRVPFTFVVPADAATTDDSISANQVIWRLDASAETSGIDYAAQFELPVFRTGESTLEVHRIVPTAADAAMWTPSRESRITVTPLPTGGDEIRITSHARMREIVPLFFFCVIWFAAIALMIEGEAPVFFPILFLLIGFFIVLGMIDITLGRTLIRADQKGIAHRRTWFGIGPWMKIDPEQVESIVARPSSNSWSYDVEVIHPGGITTKTVATFVADRKDAELLAARLMRDVSAR